MLTPTIAYGPVELLRRLEALAINLERRDQMIGREMRRESVRQPQFGGQHRAEMARSEDPQRHFRSRRRHGLDALAGTRRRQEGLQLQNVLREGLGRFRRTAQRAQRELVGAWRAAEPEIDAAGKKPRQRPELLGDDIGRVVRQHDAPCPDPDGRRVPSARCASTIDVAALAMPAML